MNEATRVQFGLLRQIRDVLTEAGITWWLFGGWAMDARAGRVTRDHADIEIFILVESADAARLALTSAGCLAPPSLHPDEGQAFLRDGQEIGVTYLVSGEDGRRHAPGF